MRKKPLKGVADLSTAQLSKIFIKNLDKLYADPQVSKYFTVTAQIFNDCEIIKQTIASLPTILNKT